MADWRNLQLGQAINLKRGFDLRTSDRDETGEVPVISSSGVSGHHNLAKVGGPGVVTGRYGSVGNVFFVNQPFWPLNTALYVEDFKGNDERFIYYFLQRIPFHRFSDKTSVPGVNRNDLHRIKVKMPPVTEQKQIASVLDAWEEAIELTERLIEALKHRKNGLMQRLLFGVTRFPMFIESDGIAEERSFNVPEDWEYVQISEVATQSTTKNISDHSLPVLSCTKYDGLVDSLEYFGRKIYSENTATYRIVERGQFAYATNHIEEGSIGYQNLHDRALISPMYTVFLTNDRVNDEYLYRVLKTETYRRIFEISTNSSVNRRGSLRWNDFSRIKIPLPGVEEQTSIAKTLIICEQEVAHYQEYLRLLMEQKKGLMQRLLTGQVRLKVD